MIELHVPGKSFYFMGQTAIDTLQSVHGANLYIAYYIMGHGSV